MKRFGIPIAIMTTAIMATAFVGCADQTKSPTVGSNGSSDSVESSSDSSDSKNGDANTASGSKSAKAQLASVDELKELIAKHKGKVVLLSMWAEW